MSHVPAETYSLIAAANLTPGDEVICNDGALLTVKSVTQVGAARAEALDEAMRLEDIAEIPGSAEPGGAS